MAVIDFKVLKIMSLFVFSLICIVGGLIFVLQEDWCFPFIHIIIFIQNIS